jgi:penicillin amidase
MHIMRRRVAWVLLLIVLLLAVAATAGFLWVRGQLRASLPLLDGRTTLAHLQRPVSVTRDALGIPAIRGFTREDVARATGFLHAQDRFFQMDLARRRAAGELAELVGEQAVLLDRQTRIHRFRAEARRAVSLLSDRDRRILDAYVDGVNAGLAQLGARPFEYLLLRPAPQKWDPEYTLLVVLSMFLTLQDSEGAYESTLATMHDVLPAAMADFLAPRGTEWETPVDGETFAVPPVPGPGIYNLRARRTGHPAITLPPPKPELALDLPGRRGPVSGLQSLVSGEARGGDEAIGSNNLAVAGRLTATGDALVADDMHLAVRVPNTWYRAVFVWGDRSDGANRSRVVVGVTLPGHPAMVIGSNSQVAWGFTNTYMDATDVVLLEIDPAHPDSYRAPGGWQRFEHFDEVINVAGGASERLPVTWTIWGPVIDPDHTGRPRALKWAAHAAERLASTMTPLESVRTLEEAFDEANGLGAPGQNMLAADRSGRIGWSIYGFVPRRTGIDGRLPASWADGAHGWNGWLAAPEFPRIIDPASGRLWSANNRVAGGAAVEALGNGNYDLGPRARIIRDRLAARNQFEPGDLLAIQLDTSGGFLSRWRDLALRTLTPEAIRGHASRAEFRDVVEKTWTGQASTDSAAYRLTRMFRERVSERVIAFLLSECYEADATFDYRVVRQREGPIWKVVTEQPPHLLDPAFTSWQELLVASVDEVIDLAHRDHSGPLRERTWGEYNVTAYRHPLSGALPLLWRWLDMPAQSLPGDLYTPNMHWGARAPSERMIVAPGREYEGMMHMPTGQSGHPLSPFYGNSHPAWVKGEMTPLMPGRAVHALTLAPPPTSRSRR